MDGNEILRAATGEPFGSMALASRAQVIRVNLVRAYGLRGLASPPGPEIDALTRELVSKIERSYRHMTASELAMVMEAGVSGELGGGVSVTCANIFGWIASYMSSELRKETLRTRMRNSYTRGPALPAEEIVRRNANAEINGARSLWAEYKANGALDEKEHLDGYVAMVCDGLMKRGKIRPNKAAIDEADRRARAEAKRLAGFRSIRDGEIVQKRKKHLLLMYFAELYERLEDLPELK